MKYNDFVVAGILGDDNLKIKEVKSLISLNSLHYNVEFYSLVESLITQGNIGEVKKLELNLPNNGEYLEIMTFKDENFNDYIVTVYDSDLLEQDPQVLKIYLLNDQPTPNPVYMTKN